MRILILLAVLFTFQIASAKTAATTDCPKKIGTSQQLSEKATGWKVFKNQNDVHVLKSIEYYDGHPNKQASLKPDNGDTKENPNWTFDKSNEIWQVCTYTNSKISLTKKLQAGLTSCTVKYNKEVNPQIDNVECK